MPAIGDRHRIADILQPLGLALLGLGDRPDARAAYEEALDPRAALDDATSRPPQRAGAPIGSRGPLDTAEPLYEQVVAYP